MLCSSFSRTTGEVILKKRTGWLFDGDGAMVAQAINDSTQPGGTASGLNFRMLLLERMIFSIGS